ncbi:MAG: hypothetical protein Q9227_006160 [Pyrenula ochraceoflavens]
MAESSGFRAMNTEGCVGGAGTPKDVNHAATRQLENDKGPNSKATRMYDSLLLRQLPRNLPSGSRMDQRAFQYLRSLVNKSNNPETALYDWITGILKKISTVRPALQRRDDLDKRSTEQIVAWCSEIPFQPEFIANTFWGVKDHSWPSQNERSLAVPYSIAITDQARLNRNWKKPGDWVQCDPRGRCSYVAAYQISGNVKEVGEHPLRSDIVLCPCYFNPSLDEAYWEDQRTFWQVKAQGLNAKPMQNTFDGIRPRARFALHEANQLIHWATGAMPMVENPGTLFLSESMADDIEYQFEALRLLRANNDPACLVNAATIEALAFGIALQIDYNAAKKKTNKVPSYWGYGILDRKTLEAPNKQTKADKWWKAERDAMKKELARLGGGRKRGQLIVSDIDAVHAESGLYAVPTDSAAIEAAESVNAALDNIPGADQDDGLKITVQCGKTTSSAASLSMTFLTTSFATPTGLPSSVITDSEAASELGLLSSTGSPSHSSSSAPAKTTTQNTTTTPATTTTNPPAPSAKCDDD